MNTAVLYHRGVRAYADPYPCPQDDHTTVPPQCGEQGRGLVSRVRAPAGHSRTCPPYPGGNGWRGSRTFNRPFDSVERATGVRWPVCRYWSALGGEPVVHADV